MVAFTIEATDAENDPLTYSLAGANAGYFTVDKNTGAVSIKRLLDREVWCGGSRDPSVVNSFILILCVCVFSMYQFVFHFLYSSWWVI